MFFRKQAKEEKGYPTIYFFDKQRNKTQHFPSNVIKTTKYKWWSFVFVFLFNQFKYFINMFFLIVAILACIPQLNAGSPVASIVPICIMLTFSCIRELFDEIRKYHADSKLNSCLYTKLVGPNEHAMVKSKDIYAGDILILRSNARVPTDGVPLATTNDDGVVYIETAELDGESNLKQRLVPSFCMEKTEEEICTFVGDSFDTIPPDPLFDHFIGTFNIGESKYSTSEKNFIPSGCVLRNTEEMLMLVVYCGTDTKLSRNSLQPRIKFARTNEAFNRFVAVALVFDFVVIIASTLCYFAQHYSQTEGKMWYIPKINNIYLSAFLRAFGFLNMFSFLVPVSCLVSLEFSKTFQMLFMVFDADLQINVLNPVGKNETRGCMPWTGTLNDELGLVEYILSDKTGTLTENEMKFRKCSIDGFCLQEEGDGCIVQYMNDPSLTKNKTNMDEFLKCMAICHEAVPNFQGVKLSFQSGSPDEVALCEEASQNGYIFTKRTQKRITLMVGGEEREVDIQVIMPFTSERKRMSVLVRLWDGRIALYSKGADLTMIPLMCDTEEPQRIQETVNLFACEGLRTLVLACRIIGEEEYKTFMEKYNNASSLIENRETKVDAVVSEIEKSLRFLGVCGIEDRLQDGVPETIQSLRRGGIKIWMITGDKVETVCYFLVNVMYTIIAMNIAKTCGLFLDEEVYRFDSDNCEKMVEDEWVKRYSVVFDFGVYNKLKENEKFWLKLINSVSVVCCRVTPQVKGEIMKTVKKKTDKVCLGIGDGGNDISLIKESNVGIGIFGKEGTQAAQSSDYAVRKFRHLEKLIYYHGRQALRRNSLIVKLSFYKNVTFIMIQFWFGIMSKFSCTSLYEDMIITLFNMVMTSMPPVFIGAFEVDIPFFGARDYPETHKEIIEESNTFKGISAYVFWLVYGLYQSVVLFVMGYVIINSDVFEWSGRVNGMGCLSTLVTLSGVLCILVTMGLSVKRWSFYLAVGFVLSFVLSIVSIVMVSFVKKMSKAGLSSHSLALLLEQPNTYLFVVVFVLVAIAPLLIRNTCNRLMAPKAYQIVQEVINKEGLPEYGVVRPVYQEGSIEAKKYFSQFCKAKDLHETHEIEMKAELKTDGEEHTN
ncbi:phospholipid-transporting ATPase, putative [Entamoeba invadens IP1]|uniref:Phospholipid-transporting ATPase n=1 Tax=Entamoeba invadens IP1 TaxID=370355 RepID=A0A0A1U7G4_ENTIV|nr:phospholipid-transporting ATPase, putative [Entamoeba invadens IP1]ELP87921.1 phospholipid-transporting ATPase, putative [Entamoeba invadens IP1]|eukprot:XP_004254692.1 phospholipid-transporting ATPase, putative [Entamoeba invadens IP1]